MNKKITILLVIISAFLLLTPSFVFAGSCNCLIQTNPDKWFCVKNVTEDICKQANQNNASWIQKYLTGAPSASLQTCLFISNDNCIAAESVNAPSQPKEAPFVPLEPKLQIPIPDLTFSKITKEGQYIGIPYLADYIAGVYKYAVGIVSIIAIIMIMVGGLRYLTAGGNAAAITSAREMISGAVIGLILLLGSYTVLYTINPDLVSFNALRIKLIKPDPLDSTPETSEMVVGSDTGGCKAAPEMKDLIKIAGDNIKGDIASSVTQPVLDILQKAAVAIKDKGCTVVYAHGARMGSSQLGRAGTGTSGWGVKQKCQWSDQYKTYVNCKPAMGSWGSTLPEPKSTTCQYKDPDTPISPCCNLKALVHYDAVDVRAANSSGKTCGKVDCITHKCQRELIKAITTNGGCILLGRDIETKKDTSSAMFEPWHFEQAMRGNGGCFKDANKILNTLGGTNY